MSGVREAGVDASARGFVLRWYRHNRRHGMTPAEAAREVWRDEAEALARLILEGVSAEGAFSWRTARYARALASRTAQRRDVRGGFWLTGKVTVFGAGSDTPAPVSGFLACVDCGGYLMPCTVAATGIHRGYWGRGGVMPAALDPIRRG